MRDTLTTHTSNHIQTLALSAMMPISQPQLLPMGGLVYNPLSNCLKPPTPTRSSRRLFIGDIPKNIKADSVKSTLAKMFPTANKIDVYSELNNNRNRGFAFLEYDNPDEAQSVRVLITNSPPTIQGRQISCDWAQLEQPEVSEEVLKQVKVLFIRNVHIEVTEEKLLEFCGGVAAGIEKVKRQKMHAFVHFQTRRQASLKKDELNGQLLNGLVLEVVWSKPKPRSHPYLPTIPSLNPEPIPPLLYPMPAIRQPDMITPTLVSPELLNSRSSIKHNFQILFDLCKTISVALPLFFTEVYYNPDPFGNLNTTFRVFALFENGVRIEGETRPEMPFCMESTLISTVAFAKTVRDIVNGQSTPLLHNKQIPWM